MALQIGTGAPAANLGTDGDYYLQFDVAGNRYFVGPKANGAWPNTYASLQGPSGPALLTGIGAPSAGLGAQGQGYTDMASGLTYLKSSSGWGNAIGTILGPQGAAGPSGQSVPSLNSASYAYAPNFCNGTAIALSGSQQALPVPGSTQPGYFTPAVPATLVSSMFVLSSANSPGSVTFRLLETNTGNTLYTYTINTFGTVSNQTGLSVNLTAGYTYQWTVTGSGNAFVQVSPVFQQASTMPISISYGPSFQSSVAITPTTATAIMIPGSASVTQYWAVPKTALLYAAQFTNTAGSAATFGLYNAGGTVIYSTSVPANSVTPYIVGPNTLQASTTLATNYYTWRVTCSSSGLFGVQPQVLM